MSGAKRPSNAEVAVGKDFAASIVMFHAALAARLGLNATDHKALDLVARQGPLSAGSLAELTGLTTGAVTGIVDRLERAGFVRRVRDEGDRRVVRIEAVPERRTEIDRLVTPMRTAMAEMQKEFTGAELESIARHLRRVTEIMSAETARLRDGAL